MSEFKTVLEVRALPETEDQQWQLISDLVYQSDVMNCNIRVPAGFITDFVSFGPLKGMGYRPAVVHDYLYSCGNVEREDADAVLKEALLATGVDELLAISMYEAVRAFGGPHKTNENVFKGE